MKKMYFLAFCFLLNGLLAAQSDTLHLEGKYRGKNIYIQNPANDMPVGMCVENVFLNGNEVPFRNEPYFVIRFDSLPISINDPIKIDIIHKRGCMPRVLNDNTDMADRNAHIVSAQIDKNAMLHFTTQNETMPSSFCIEQYKWNKWVKVGELSGKGISKETEYKFQLLPHSGENKFRIKQIDDSGKTSLSQSLTFTSPAKKIKLKNDPAKISNSIDFTATTMFELFDENGNIVKKGTAQSIDCADLKRGIYYLNFDSETIEITKFY